MRLPSLLLAAACLTACGAASSDDTPVAPAPRTRTYAYPGGIKATLGTSPTADFLAANVTAAGDRQRLADDGLRFVRLDMLWQDIETAPGVWNWTHFDAVVDDLLARHMTPIFTVVYANPAYDDAGLPCPHPDGYAYVCLGSDFGPYFRFAATAAARYRGKVKLYEIWNEPNGWFRFWPRVVGGDPAAYAQLMAGAADAIHAACGDCQVLSGGMVFLNSPIEWGQVEFMQRMRAAVPDVFQKADGIGFHAYTFYPPVDPPESKTLNQTPFDEALAAVRAACVCDKPLWVTETGWTSVGSLTEERRAQFGIRGWLLSLSQGVKASLWWSVRDYHAAHVVAPQETHFGLLDRDGHPHPVYEALVSAEKLVGDAVEVTDVRGEYGFAAPYTWALRLGWPGGKTGDVLWYAGLGEGPLVPATLHGKAAVRLRDGAAVTPDRLDGEPVLFR